MVKTIESCIRPKSWDIKSGPGTIMPYEATGITAIVVNQTDRVHGDIEALLSQLRSVRHASTSKPQESIEPLSPPISKAEESLRRALRKPITIQFKETPLSQITSFLREKTGLPIVLDTKWIGNPVSVQTPITVKARDIPLESALYLILHPLRLTWTFHNECLLIIAPEEEEILLTTRCYDVSDLPTYRNELGEGMLEYDDIIDVITKAITENTWNGVAYPGSIAAFEGNGIQAIVVYQTWQNHRKIEALLAELRRLCGRAPTKEDIEKLPLAPKPPSINPANQKPGAGGKGLF